MITFLHTKNIIIYIINYIVFTIDAPIEMFGNEISVKFAAHPTERDIKMVLIH